MHEHADRDACMGHHVQSRLWVGSNGLEILVDNVVIMQVLHTGQCGSENCDSISLGKPTMLADSLEEFSANCKLEREIIR